MTKAQEAFCYEYLANGFNATQAYYKAYPEAKTYNTASTMSSKLLKKPEIKSFIDKLVSERFEALNINSEKIINKLAEIAFSPKGDEYYSAQAQLKALETLTKVYSLESRQEDKVIEVKLTQ